MPEKLSAEQAQRAEQIQQFIKSVEHVQRLVAELEANRNQPKIADNICHTIAREMSQLRHRAVAANVSTIADVAGSMSVLATRSGNLNMKIRGLRDAVNNIQAQLDHELKAALHPERKGPQQPRP
ncbi:MAG: hypothetical protein DMD53_13600 [Gemmatimonadetes bacterium]|nr:MAG: hypothetical protein DMD53_13600 [Gemmatimonadota bacterium]